MRRPTQNRDHPDAAIRGIQIIAATMEKDQKPGAVWEPDSTVNNRPRERTVLEFVRLRESASLAGFDESQVHAQRIDIRQIFSVRRDGAVLHGMLAGVGGELAELDFRKGAGRLRLAFSEPENRASDG